MCIVEGEKVVDVMETVCFTLSMSAELCITNDYSIIIIRFLYVN